MVTSQLEIKLRPSKILASLLLFIHLGAILCLYYLAIPKWLLLGISAIIFLNFSYFFYSKILLLGKKTINKIQVIAPNKWLLINNSKQKLDATLCPDSFMSRHLVILNFKFTSKRFKSGIVIFADSIDTELLRQLKVLCALTKPL